MQSFKDHFHSSRQEGSVVIVGGMHGDEKAGNIAANSFKGTKGIHVISDINTSDKRRLDGKDFNRHFDTKDSNDLNDSILERILDILPRLVIDLHEDIDARGVYVYCTPSLTPKIQSILDEHDLPLAKSAMGDKVNKGVVDHGHLPSKGTLERALAKRDIPYCTFETPTSWPLEKRVKVLRMLVRALV